MSTRPLVSARIASAISLARRFIGCETGRVFADLYVNSALCAEGSHGGSARVPAALARIWRRESCMSVVSVVVDRLVVAPHPPGRRESAVPMIVRAQAGEGVLVFP